MNFSDGTHCHWTYRVGNYESFLNWPTREEALEALGDHAGEVFQRHGRACASHSGKLGAESDEL